MTVDLRGGALLVLDGPSLHSDDLQVLQAFVAQLGAALEQRDLRAEAQVAAAAAEGDRLRTAILRAVSHDLRTPLASIKASVTSLMQHDVEWSEHDRDEFLSTIEEETDRLNRMVGNLLDMSRLQSGIVEPGPAARRARGGRAPGPGQHQRRGRRARAQPGRGRGRRAAPAGRRRPRPARAGGRQPRGQRARCTRARARRCASRAAGSAAGSTCGSSTTASGCRCATGRRCSSRSSAWATVSPTPASGLGLAVSRGFVDAMGGELSVDDTPGGGLTFTVSLPVAS